MNFELSDDQQEIKRTAHDVLAARASWARVREHAERGEYDLDLWRELSDLGWPGIAVAEEAGGQGLGMVELCVLAEELGYTCAPVPLLGSALAALALEPSDERLAALAAGSAIGTLGRPEDLAPDAPGADVAIVAAGDALQLAGGVEEATTIDSTRRWGRLVANGEQLAGDGAATLDAAAVVVAAELVGVCQRALDMTLEYVKDRKQFGVPVGSFQAVQHRAAQMLLDTESARSATYYAAWAADAEPASLPVGAAMAKAVASDAGRAVTAAAIQLHGGIGFTWEADVHWLFKRAQLDARLLGGGGEHRARLARIARRKEAAVS